MKKMFLKKNLFLKKSMDDPLLTFFKKFNFWKKTCKMSIFYKIKFFQVNIYILFVVNKKKNKNSCWIFIYGTMKKVVLFFIVSHLCKVHQVTYVVLKNEFY